MKTCCRRKKTKIEITKLRNNEKNCTEKIQFKEQKAS